jgi:hypothetical protein
MSVAAPALQHVVALNGVERRERLRVAGCDIASQRFKIDTPDERCDPISGLLSISGLLRLSVLGHGFSSMPLHMGARWRRRQEKKSPAVRAGPASVITSTDRRALVNLRTIEIEGSKFPLSPRIEMLNRIRAKLMRDSAPTAHARPRQAKSHPALARLALAAAEMAPMSHSPNVDLQPRPRSE